MWLVGTVATLVPRNLFATPILWDFSTFLWLKIGPNSFVPPWMAFPTMRIVVGPCRSSPQIPQIPHVSPPTGIEWPGVHAADFLTNRRVTLMALMHWVPIVGGCGAARPVQPPGVGQNSCNSGQWSLDLVRVHVSYRAVLRRWAFRPSCGEAAAWRWSEGFLDCFPPSPHWLSHPRNGSREIPQRDAGRVLAPVLGGFAVSRATPMGYDFTSLRTGGLDG